MPPSAGAIVDMGMISGDCFSEAELLNDSGRVCATLQGAPGVTLHCVDAFVLELLCHSARLLHDQDSEFSRKRDRFLRWASVSNRH